MCRSAYCPLCRHVGASACANVPNCNNISNKYISVGIIVSTSACLHLEYIMLAYISLCTNMLTRRQRNMTNTYHNVYIGMHLVMCRHADRPMLSVILMSLITCWCTDMPRKKMYNKVYALWALQGAKRVLCNQQAMMKGKALALLKSPVEDLRCYLYLLWVAYWKTCGVIYIYCGLLILFQHVEVSSCSLLLKSLVEVPRWSLVLKSPVEVSYGRLYILKLLPQKLLIFNTVHIPTNISFLEVSHGRLCVHFCVLHKFCIYFLYIYFNIYFSIIIYIIYIWYVIYIIYFQSSGQYSTLVPIPTPLGAIFDEIYFVLCNFKSVR